MLWVQAMPSLSRFRPLRYRLVLLAGLLAAGACGQQQQPAPEPADNDETATKLPVIPKPKPPLDRAALLDAVRQAASAAAAGARAPESLRDLDGKQFELRIRFGCGGPSTELAKQPLGWSYDAAESRLRVRAQPTIGKDDPLVAAIAGDSFEAVEGFWIPRPWLLQATCPAQPKSLATAPEPANAEAAPAETTSEPVEARPSAPRIGIAQFFTPQDPRTRQRGGRAYEAVKTVLPAGVPTQGFNLVLAGRLRALGDRGVIQCVARSASSPPECVISAEFLNAWIERPGSGEIVAEWGGG
jgi:hypothetical protein